MPQISCMPRGWFGLRYDLKSMGQSAELVFQMITETGSMTVDRASFQIEKAGWLSGHWKLRGSRGVVMEAQKSSAFRRSFVLSRDDRSMNLSANGIFTLSYTLEQQGKTLATFEKLSLFSRAIVITTQGREQDFETLAFAAWLVLMLKRRRRKRNRSN